MTSHFANEKYHLLNTRISENLLQGGYPVRSYQNASLALYDITMGLQQYLSHRNYLGIVSNGSSLINNLLPVWLRQSVPLQVKEDSQTWFEYIEILNSETNFVVWSSENEITGEVIVSESEAKEIHARLAKKRIFSIQVTHQMNSHTFLSPYSIIVLRKSILKDDGCLVVMTDKMKASSLIGSYQNIDRIAERVHTQQPQQLDLAVIENKLKDLNALYFDQFVSMTPRLCDRIVFSFRHLNAYAVQQAAGLTNQNSFAPAVYPFWVLDSWSKWWKECGKDSIIRGLLIVDAQAFIQDSELTVKIHASVDKIQRLGQWNVLP